MRRTMIAILLLPSLPAQGQSIDRILAAAAERRKARGCAVDERDDITVCARDDRRHRLPLRTERSPLETGAVAGEAPRATATDPFLKGCGIFRGQNARCSRREAAAYGYGGGRDPVTLVGRLIRKAVDPDAEVGPPPDAPPATRE